MSWLLDRRIEENTAMLKTGLEHIESEQAYQDTLAKNDNVMVSCGRIGPNAPAHL